MAGRQVGSWRPVERLRAVCKTGYLFAHGDWFMASNGTKVISFAYNIMHLSVFEIKYIVTDKITNYSVVFAFLTNLADHREINVLNFGT